MNIYGYSSNVWSNMWNFLLYDDIKLQCVVESFNYREYTFTLEIGEFETKLSFIDDSSTNNNNNNNNDDSCEVSQEINAQFTDAVTMADQVGTIANLALTNSKQSLKYLSMFIC